MKIAVSRSACRPLQKTTSSTSTTIGGKCSGCGIKVASGLEWHELLAPKGHPKKRFKLCPLCHCSQHLDVAGLLDAGTMIWLPEIEQQQLNMMCHIIFAAVHEQKGSALDTKPEQNAQVERMRGLYKSFMSRSAGVVALFGGRNSSINATNPAVIAQHMLRVLDEKKVGLGDLNKKLDGLRFLPSPKVFERFNLLAAETIRERHPVDTWRSMATDTQQAAVEPAACDGGGAQTPGPDNDDETSHNHGITTLTHQ